MSEAPDPSRVERSPVERRLALLWEPRVPTGRGRKPRLTLDEVVEAGIAVAASAGLDGLSMRKVATQVGVGTMSLYTYVPGRTELIDLMIDKAYAELTMPAPDLAWRPGLEQYAREHWELFRRHPWLLQANMWRAPLSPHVLDAQEAGLRTLIGTGLSEARVVEILGLIDSFVAGVARTAAAEEREQAESGMSYDAYWESLNSFWATYFDPERYPTMVRVHQSGAFDTAGTPFELRLDRLLDGIALTIADATR